MNSIEEQISKNVLPEQYTISLDIDLYKWVFKGKETIIINVSELYDTLVCKNMRTSILSLNTFFILRYVCCPDFSFMES